MENRGQSLLKVAPFARGPMKIAPELPEFTRIFFVIFVVNFYGVFMVIHHEPSLPQRRMKTGTNELAQHIITPAPLDFHGRRKNKRINSTRLEFCAITSFAKLLQ